MTDQSNDFLWRDGRHQTVTENLLTQQNPGKGPSPATEEDEGTHLLSHPTLPARGWAAKAPAARFRLTRAP